MKAQKLLRVIAATTALSASPVLAATCDKVTFSDPAWTDIAATTAATSLVLEALGYETETQMLALPVTFQALAAGQLDVYLGLWLPTMKPDITPYLEAGTIDMVKKNLVGAKYTLATNAAGAALGITQFSDIAQHKDALSGKIYALEPGNDGNSQLLKMIEGNHFDLSGWELMESSEQGMLAQVTRASNRNEPVIFLGWEPHPMNVHLNLTYLEGGDEFFGPNLGSAEVFTTTRKGYLEACPNVGTLLNNLEFSLEMENQIMSAIIDDGQEPRAAAETWLRANLSTAEGWLENVTTRDGGDAKAALAAAFN